MGPGIKLAHLFADRLVYIAWHTLSPADSAPDYLKHLLPNLVFEITWNGYGIPGRGADTRLTGDWMPTSMHFTVQNRGSQRIFVGSTEVPQGHAIPITWGQSIQLVDGEELRRANLPEEYLQIAFIAPSIPPSNAAPNDAFHAEYKLCESLNGGGFGTVHRAVRFLGGGEFAVKIIRKTMMAMRESELVNIERECEIMQQVSSHMNVVRYYRAYNCQDQLYIVMELVRGSDLQKLLVQHQLNEDEARYLFRQLIHGMAYLHSRGIVHRDLKPENIMITMDNPPILKIADFGLSKTAHSRTALKTFCGTEIFMAPEVFSPRKKSYDASIDVWAIGLILFTMLTRHYALPSREKGDPTWSPRLEIMRLDLLNRVSDEAKDLFFKLVVEDPKRRITLQEALKHPWLQQSHARPDQIFAEPSTAPLTPESQVSGSLPGESWTGFHSTSIFHLQGLSSSYVNIPGGYHAVTGGPLITPQTSRHSEGPSRPLPAKRSSERLRLKKSASLPKTRSMSNSMGSKHKGTPRAAAPSPSRTRKRNAPTGKRKGGIDAALAV
ncbi:kinase-like protein [Dacryopinax primogenitus]|uniref:Kinase-like protein n=1 Tax=Dacryopinax primogenitus (strain DJM 731) TaxID=1858805 RepID=M5GFX4_DACPD|nr:kinase-like protein [Dacryopinax primogenitus]EJU04528.1 kinase-like protein [Dacryopinax primogenitus]